MRLISTYIFGSVIALTPILSVSASLVPEEEIKLRQQTFKQMGLNFDVLGKMAKEKTPYNKEEAIRLVTELEIHAKKFPELFSPSSSKGNTKTRQEVWSESGKWSAATSGFQDEMKKLTLSVRNGGLGELKAGYHATSQSCKSCHDNFRTR